MLLWLWCRPAATAPIRPLAWEPPYAVGGAQEMAKKKKKRKKREDNDTMSSEIHHPQKILRSRDLTDPPRSSRKSAGDPHDTGWKADAQLDWGWPPRQRKRKLGRGLG